MKTTLANTAILAVSIFLLASCSKEDVYISLDQFKTFTISETISNDESYMENIQTKEVFSFYEGKLQTVKFTQTIPYYKDSIGNPITMECQSRISYDNNKVSVTGCTNDELIYSLNNEGFASTYEVAESDIYRYYEFTYINGYLASVIEKIENETTAQIKLSYEEGNLSKTETEKGEQKYAYNYTATAEKNVSELPLFQLAETYPLSFHKAALFAGILGKSPKNFIKQISIENSSTTFNYTYKYDANGYVTSCTIEIKNEFGSMYRELNFSYE